MKYDLLLISVCLIILFIVAVLATQVSFERGENPKPYSELFMEETRQKLPHLSERQ